LRWRCSFLSNAETHRGLPLRVVEIAVDIVIGCPNRDHGSGGNIGAGRPRTAAPAAFRFDSDDKLNADVDRHGHFYENTTKK
jgi:hypothetical protein